MRNLLVEKLSSENLEDLEELMDQKFMRSFIHSSKKKFNGERGTLSSRFEVSKKMPVVAFNRENWWSPGMCVEFPCTTTDTHRARTVKI